MSMASGCQGVFQIPNDIFHRPVLLARNGAQWAAVMLLRLKPEGVEQDRGRDVMRVGDEGQRHPGTDRLVLPSQVTGVSPSPETENEGSRNSHAKRQREDD